MVSHWVNPGRQFSITHGDTHTVRYVKSHDGEVGIVTDLVIRKIPWERVRVAGAVRPDLAAKYNDQTIGNIARAENKEPLDAFLDLTLADDLRTLYQFESANLDRDVVRTLLQEPRFMLGISDAGAHIDQVCDLRYPTVLLGDWVRDQRFIAA